MNPRLVTCLIGSTLIGLSAAILAVSAGTGVIAGIFVLSLVGSTTLLTSSLVAAWIDERRPPAAVVATRSTVRV